MENNNNIQHAKRKAQIYYLINEYQEKIERAKKNIQAGNRYIAADFMSQFSNWLKFSKNDNYEEATENGVVTMPEEFRQELHELVVENYIASCKGHIETLEHELRTLMPQAL